MSWPWSELGLDGPADLSAIRGAYAKRLKTTHPEEDPEGFGRLHAAYQEARRRAKGPGPRPPDPGFPPPAGGGRTSPLDFDWSFSRGGDRPPPRPPVEYMQTWDFDRLLSEGRPPHRASKKLPPVWNDEALHREEEKERARRLIRVGGEERLAGPRPQPKKRGRRAPWLVAVSVFLLLVYVGPHLVFLPHSSQPQLVHHSVLQKNQTAGLDQAVAAEASPYPIDPLILEKTLMALYDRPFTIQPAPDGDGYAAVPVDDPGLRFRVRPQYDELNFFTDFETNYTDMLLCRALRLFAWSHELDLFYDEDWQDKRGPTLHDLDSPACYCLFFPLTGGEDLLRELCTTVNALMEEPAFQIDPPSVQLHLGQSGSSLLSLQITGGKKLDVERLVEEIQEHAVP